jgi:hypothetical protein
MSIDSDYIYHKNEIGKTPKKDFALNSAQINQCKRDGLLKA